MKLAMKWVLSIIFCMSLTYADDLDLSLDDSPTQISSLTSLSTAPDPSLAPDLNMQINPNAAVINNPTMSADELSLDDSGNAPAAPINPNPSIDVALPVIGTIHLYPINQNGIPGLATYIPEANKPMAIGPLIIERSQFKIINKKISYSANITLFGTKGTVSISPDSIPSTLKNLKPATTQPKIKKTTTLPALTFDLNFNQPPTLDLIINDAKIQLLDVKLVLNKNDVQTPTKITAQTVLLNQPVMVTIGISKKGTNMWAQLPTQQLIAVIPQVKNTPLEDSILSNAQITLKNIDAKDKSKLESILDGEITVPAINGLQTSSTTSKQLTMRAVWNKTAGGYLITTATDFVIPSVGTITNGSFTVNFPILKKSSKAIPEQNVILSGDIRTTIATIGTFNASINARVSKKGFVFASTLNQTVAIGDVNINPATISYSSLDKKLMIMGKATIQGYSSTVQISYIPTKKGATTSIQAQLDNKTIQPFSTLPVPALFQTMTFDNPHFTFNQTPTGYTILLAGTVTFNNMPLATKIQTVQNKGKTTKLITIQGPQSFKISDAFPELKSTSFNDFVLQNPLLIISSDDYQDSTTKITYKKGLNIVGDATITGGGLQQAATFAHTTGSIGIVAYIAPTPINSALSVKMSDGFTISNNNQVAFGPLYLTMDGSHKSFFLKGTLLVKPSPQDDQLVFDALITFDATGGTVAGTMNGVWQHPFGINGLNIGSNDPQSPVQGVAAQVTLVPGPEPVESIGLAGALQMGTKFATMAVKVGPTPVLYGQLNALTLMDLVSMAQKASGKKIQGLDNLPIKDFSINDIKIYIVNQDTTIGDFKFDKGLTLRGGIQFPGLQAFGNITLSPSTGFFAQAYCSPIIFGSTKIPALKITKADSDHDIRTGPISLGQDNSSQQDSSSLQLPDPSKPQTQELADTFKNGPMLLINVPVPAIVPVFPEIKVSGQFQISDFISTAADLHIAQNGMTFTFITSLGQTTYLDKNNQPQPLLQSTIIGATSGTLASNPNFTIDLNFQNNLQDYIMQQVTLGIKGAKDKVSQEIALAAQAAAQKLTSAQQSVSTTQNAATAALLAANNQAQQNLTNAQDTVNTLQKRIDELNASIARHKSACALLNLNDCAWLIPDGTELASKITAQATAVSALATFKDIAKGTLSAVNSITQTTSSSVSTVLGGVNQISQGTLIVAKKGTDGILSAVDQATQTILSTFDINQLKYHGDLQSFATGKLGNVTCSAHIFGQQIDFSFTLDVHNATNSIGKVVNDIVEKMKNKIKNIVIVV